MRYGNGGYPRYVSVAEKKARAEKKLKALQKKNPGIRPVLLDGQTLARTWWGKSWNKNLERYADYDNRIDRGRGYVRHGAVLDLQVLPGEVRALVQGSTAQPYQVVVAIKAIAKSRWLDIKRECQGKLDSLPELLAGKIPAPLQEVFMRAGGGLFPTPKEITFDCSCPDWASMCKHVAAVLYGIGARLDEDPSLFFTLRKVAVHDLITAAVKETTARILTTAAPRSAKVIADADLAGIFGISMDAPDGVPPLHPPQAERQEGKRPWQQLREKPIKAAKPLETKAQEAKPAAAKTQRKQIRGVLPESVKKLSQERLAAKRKISDPQVPEDLPTRICTIIRSCENGIAVDELSTASGCPKQKLYAIVHRLKAQGKITSLGHGVYGKG